MIDINEMVKAHKNLSQDKHHFVAWLQNAVRIGVWTPHKGFEVPDGPVNWDLLLSVRIFNATDELHIFKYQDKYRSRLKTDGDHECQYLQEPFLWGLKLDGSAVYEPNRGMRLELPFKVNEQQLPLRYRVVNYYEFDDDGQIRFTDARLSHFLDRDGNELEDNHA